MRSTNKTIISATVAVALLLTALITPQVLAQKKTPALKIGAYDSRIVTFAWSRSDFFKQHMIKLKQQNDSAQKAHDTAMIKELSILQMTFQHLLHQMVFSNGSAGMVMTLVNDKLPDLAKKEGVSVILSKWELDFSDPSIEIVDLTNQVAQLFQPKEDISRSAGEISKQPPVPIDELGMEADMMDLYCERFGKK
ncbi:MAG: hypothetical protein Q8M08_13245 [Bacteroidales bacterium]|nr:hypothetical protein [Bacteroidales bacterium]